MRRRLGRRARPARLLEHRHDPRRKVREHALEPELRLPISRIISDVIIKKAKEQEVAML